MEKTAMEMNTGAMKMKTQSISKTAIIMNTGMTIMKTKI